MKKRRIKSILWSCGLLLLVVFLACVPLLMELGAGASAGGPSIVSAQAEIGSIPTDLACAGSLCQQDSIEIDAPKGVMLRELLIEDGQHIAKDQILAKVDRVSVMSTIARVQQTLELLNGQIEEASDQKERSKLRCPAGGRVMAIYCESGDDVRDVMLSHGALAILSLDGMLSVRISTDQAVSVGDEVFVVLSDGTKRSGRVESALAGLISVTLSDEDAALGQSVRVEDLHGETLGSGELRAHSEWRAAASSGVVDALNAEVGEVLEEGDPVLTVTGANSVEYERLCACHRVYEDMLTELFVLYQEKTVKAPESGVVSVPEDTDAFMLCAGDAEPELYLLANAPDGNDEAVYVNFAGIVTAIGDDGLSMNMRPTPLTVEDYLTVSVSQDEMTVPMVILAAAIALTGVFASPVIRAAQAIAGLG